MRALLISDLEGITGVDSIDMIFDQGEGYRRACELLTGDVNTAVESLLDEGVQECFVVDGHGG